MKDGETTMRIEIIRDHQDEEFKEEKMIGPYPDNSIRISSLLQQKVPEDAFVRLHIISCLNYEMTNSQGKTQKIESHDISTLK